MGVVRQPAPGAFTALCVTLLRWPRFPLFLPLLLATFSKIRYPWTVVNSLLYPLNMNMRVYIEIGMCQNTTNILRSSFFLSFTSPSLSLYSAFLFLFSRFSRWSSILMITHLILLYQATRAHWETYPHSPLFSVAQDKQDEDQRFPVNRQTVNACTSIPLI